MNDSDRARAYVINALVTDQGVHMGDHGQDVVRAVAVDPTETVESLLARTLYDHGWLGELSDIKADSYLTIRLARIDGPMFGDGGTA